MVSPPNPFTLMPCRYIDGAIEAVVVPHLLDFFVLEVFLEEVEHALGVVHVVDPQIGS